jgi:hydrogenase maturation protease
MSRPLLIGYGNLLRGDDGVAAHIVAACADQIPDIDTLLVQQLTPELAEPISRATLVIFVDASVEALPGTIRVTTLSDDRATEAPISHHISPSMLLELACGLYERCPPAVLVTVGGKVFGMQEGLSSEVRAAVVPALEEIRKLLTDHAA